MPVTLPAPYGKANWTNYEDYWREQDAEWMQDRMVLRVLFTNDIAALGLTKGGVVYDEEADSLRWRSKTDIGGNPNWKKIVPIPDSITVAETGSTTALTYKTSNQGITYSATDLAVTASRFTVLTDKLVMDATGLALKTGSWTAKLSTSTTSLVSDSPVSVPSLAATGALTAANATLTGALTVASITASGTIGGNVVNGASGTIGQVALSGNRVTASDGMNVQGGAFYGNANSALMAQSSRSGPYVQVGSGGVTMAGGGNIDMHNQPRVMAMPIQYYYSGVGIWNFAPSFYSGGDPGAQYFPDGTIWIS